LEKRGLLHSRLVPSDAGPDRKYYRTTPEGELERKRLTEAWRHLTMKLDLVLKSRQY